MVRVVVPGAPVANPRETYSTIVAESGTPGCMTSIAYSPRLQCNVGLGYVPSGNTRVGTAIEVAVAGTKRQGQIASQDWTTELEG